MLKYNDKKYNIIFWKISILWQDIKHFEDDNDQINKSG